MKRKGIIDGVKTTQKISNPQKVWSDYPKWEPIEGKYIKKFVVDHTIYDILGDAIRYSVAHFSHGEWRDVNTNKLIRWVSRWKYMRGYNK